MRPDFASMGRARRSRGRGFTLVELVMVVAMVALVAGMAVVAASGIGEKADTQVAQAECAEIRKACLRFAADMGEPPRALAELLQSPDPSDTLGG
jgi:prepilin-type N-terminal cleavage/methylation domain-containing protein